MKPTAIFAFLLALVAPLLLPAAAQADGLIIVRQPPRPPRPIPYAFAPLEVKQHHVTVRIMDQVATTEVDQVFYNPNSQQLEGTYLFPIPKGAQIDNFSMDVNGKMMKAELLDADKARKIYEDIVRSMRDPALLEYAGQAVFKVRIFPIEGRKDKRVKLSYSEVLKNDGGLMGYTYPLNTEKFSAANIASVSMKVELESRQPITTVWSPSHQVEVKRKGTNEAVVGWEAKNARPDKDFQLMVGTDAKGDMGLDVLAHKAKGDKEGTFLLLLSPGAQMKDERVVDKDVVFVLDNSGSMAEGNKMAQAQRALTFCLANLNPGDRFDVVRFSTEAEALFGKLEPADKGRREQARTFVEALTPIGGTAIEEALLMAMAPAKTQAETGRPYVVIFLTDGRPTIGETDEDRIVASVTKSLDQKAIRIFSFGIGTDINTHLLDKLTERTRATSQYVLPDQDIELEVSRFYTKINEPVLADLRLTVSGPVRVSKMEPRALPDLFKGEQLEVLGRYTGSGDVAFVLEGSVNGQPRKLVYEGRLPESDTTHESIPRLWATRRVGFLLDEIRLRGESKELRDEVTDLARRYGIVTPYTAYLIVEDEARRNVPTARRSLQIMGGDGEGVEELERSFDSMKSEKSGSGGVRAAQANQALKKAPSADYAQKQANEYAASENKDSRSTRMVQSQESRYVNGRAFYRNGEQWVDANAQDDQAEKKRKNIKFGSEEWFNLLGAHPEAGPWLALGQNVQVVLGGTLYDIRE